MKNEEIASRLSSMSLYGYSIEESAAAYNAALTMAERKDEQFAKEKQALIDKACEWLSIHDNYSTPTHILVEQLREAMKGEQI